MASTHRHSVALISLLSRFSRQMQRQRCLVHASDKVLPLVQRYRNPGVIEEKSGGANR